MATILLIDDDENVLLTMAAILRQAGHTVRTAVNGRSGIELDAAWAHDLVITDIFMPGSDGLEVILRLRSREPRPRIIAMSGGGKRLNCDYLREARLLGAQQILAKPIHADTLLQALATILPDPAPRTVLPRPVVKPAS